VCREGRAEFRNAQEISSRLQISQAVAAAAPLDAMQCFNAPCKNNYLQPKLKKLHRDKKLKVADILARPLLHLFFESVLFS
jgi:hypothetical protein